MKKILSIILILSLIFSLCACCIPLDKIYQPQQKPEDTIQAPAETMAPAEAPVEMTEPEWEPEVEATNEPPVITVIDYSRSIVDQGGTTILTHHTVKCPALSATTQDAEAINKEIYDLYAGAVFTLETYEEGDYIYHMSYNEFIYRGVVAIFLNLSVSNHYGGVFPAYRVYYFDTNTGKQLTYEQYLATLNITDAQLRQALDSTGMAGTSSYEIVWAAVDQEQTGIYARSMDFMDEYGMFVLDFSIVD